MKRSAIVAACLLIVACSRACPPTATGTLIVWQTETDQSANTTLKEKVVAAMEAEFPGLQIQLESVAWSALSAKLSAALQSGTLPDLSHVQPFMVGSLAARNLLLPLDDVVARIEKQEGASFVKNVRDLQQIDGKRYGIAYALGTTAFAYRADMAKDLGLSVPRTWKDFIDFSRALHARGLPVLLPGGDPFFIDQLFAEMVANNGAVLFEPTTRRPLLSSPKVVEVLQFFADLGPSVDTLWQSQPYLDQFNRLGRGEAGVVPVTYARASKAIEAVVRSGSSKLVASPDVFALMNQPSGPSYSGLPVATIDCEPFVIFKQAAERKFGRHTNRELAEKFLERFYAKETYLDFVQNVPIHLTPALEGLRENQRYRNFELVKNWRAWADHTESFLTDTSRTRPILMPDASELGRQLPFLLEFQASRILTEAVTDVIQNKMSATDAAKRAQDRSERLVTSLGFRRW